MNTDEPREAPHSPGPDEDQSSADDTEPGPTSDPTAPDERELFATFLSHEIRQPLGSLALWLDLLETTLGIDMGVKERRYMDRIHEEVDRITEMVDEQMVFSKIAALELQRQWVELTRVVEDVREDLRPHLERVRAEVRVGNLPRVFTDPRLLRPLMRNLLANAIQYRHPDRRFRIEISSRDPDEESDMECEVLVKDNGRGFPQEDHERIFELFERLDPDGPPGTGIGLTLSRRIAERLGGTLTARSSPGEGAVFILALPEERVEDCDIGDMPLADAGADSSGPSKRVRGRAD